MKRKRIPTEKEIDIIFERFSHERRTVMPQEIPTMELKAHPRNELIYGQEENVSDLITLIEEAGGILVPLVINDKNIILSGHRRWLAAKKLNFKTVPCEVRTFESPEDELEFLLISNVSRIKTREQKAREGIVLEEVLSAQSAERRRAKLKQFQSVRDESSTTEEMGANSSDDTILGRTRDEVAKALKIGSGKQFDRMKAVIKKADELRNQGKDDDAELFLAVLNRSASAAAELMSVALESLTDEDRENLRTGKVAPRMFLQEQTTGKSKRKSSYEKANDNIEIMENTIKALKKSVNLIKAEEEQGEIRNALRDILGQYLELQSSNQCVHCNFILAQEFLDFSITSITKYLSEGKAFHGLHSIEQCRDIINEEMESLQELLSVVESELEKGKDDE